MKFYIDFEATQFSEHIISIGCVAENGETFKTLVKPHGDEKVNQFIIDLTGITNEMLADAPDADTAFLSFFNWVAEQNTESDAMPEYFCYGDCDKRFIKKTANHMTNAVAYTFAVSLMALMVDYSSTVKNYFNAKNKIGLKRIYNMLLEEENEQHHDALEDAIMLRYVADNLTTASPEDVTNLPPKVKTNNNRAKCPEIFLNWPNGPKHKYAANTKANETNWIISATDKNNYTKYFDNMNTACLWCIKYLMTGRSPRKEADLRHVEKRIINNSHVNNTSYYLGYKWEIKESEVEE